LRRRFADGSEAAALANLGVVLGSNGTSELKILRLTFEQVTVHDGRIVTVTAATLFCPTSRFAQKAG
jgi:hypothetical protein